MGSIPRITLFKAEGCHLCERALRVVEEVRGERDFELSVVDIDGDPDLEARYREWLPVVEIDGRRSFVYHVAAADLKRRLDADVQTPSGRPVASDGRAGEARTSC